MVLAAAACSGKGEVNAARQSLYDTDFAVVYRAALDVMRELYPELAEDPTKGKIGTAWHQVKYNNVGVEDPKSIQAQDRTLDPSATGASQQLTAPSSLAYKRYFIRFDVSVTGGRPWRIRVVGHASEWEPGNQLPSELRGPATPHWLPGRTDAVVVAIYKRLREFAIAAPGEDDGKPTPDAAPAVDVTAYGPIDPDAAKRLAEVRQSITRRDYTVLREQLADDLVWSLGGSPGIDAALAMWQADPAILEAMARSIDAGCRGDDREVVCPPEATETPGYLGWRLTLAHRSNAWLVTSFVQGD
jgi:hypothetical protein